MNWIERNLPSIYALVFGSLILIGGSVALYAAFEYIAGPTRIAVPVAKKSDLAQPNEIAAEDYDNLDGWLAVMPHLNRHVSVAFDDGKIDVEEYSMILRVRDDEIDRKRKEIQRKKADDLRAKMKKLGIKPIILNEFQAEEQRNWERRELLDQMKRPPSQSDDPRPSQSGKPRRFKPVVVNESSDR